MINVPLYTLIRITEDILIGGGTGGNLRFITDILYILHCTDGGTGYNFIYFSQTNPVISI